MYLHRRAVANIALRIASCQPRNSVGAIHFLTGAIDLVAIDKTTYDQISYEWICFRLGKNRYLMCYDISRYVWFGYVRFLLGLVRCGFVRFGMVRLGLVTSCECCVCVRNPFLRASCISFTAVSALRLGVAPLHIRASKGDQLILRVSSVNQIAPLRSVRAAASQPPHHRSPVSRQRSFIAW